LNVKLIAHSIPVEDLFDDGDDVKHDLLDFVEYVARVSNPSNQNNENNKKGRLASYLSEHHHWSPFEMANVCLEINTTRDIARQILRHRSFSFQEFSQRYADPTSALAFSTREARLQDTKNRQNSYSTNDRDLQLTWEAQQKHSTAVAKSVYQWAIDNGIAKEQARAVLPEGCTNSRIYMNGTLRSWIHYIDLRTSPETQLEHREIARDCAFAIKTVFPQIMEYVNS